MDCLNYMKKYFLIIFVKHKIILLSSYTLLTSIRIRIINIIGFNELINRLRWSSK